MCTVPFVGREIDFLVDEPTAPPTHRPVTREFCVHTSRTMEMETGHHNVVYPRVFINDGEDGQSEVELGIE